ncbi:hypothetical protein ACN47E_008183 [Coniothyrium glycines]
MRSASESSSPQPQRLPVNPRRHKVAPEQRKRVIRACNACNVRRVRCSGEQPCQRCSKSLRECEYSAPESDRNALKIDNERLRTRCAALEKAFMIAAPDDAARMMSQLDHGMPVTNSSSLTFLPMLSMLNGREIVGAGRLLRDGDGHTRFLGETSGASFLDALKDFMYGLIPYSFDRESDDGSRFVMNQGRYQTFDSRPLPDPDVDPLWLPTRTDMTLMLAELRHMVQDGNGDFPSGGIYYWGDLDSLPASMASSVSLSTMTTDDTFRNLAFYHVCFALAATNRQPSFEYPERSTEAFFNRARRLLGNPLDSVLFTLDDVGVLALMGFYLIEMNRRDAAYMYVSVAIHIAIIHGAFNSQCSEAKKRIYWTLYILDRWLSILMGRPPTIADEIMRIPLPCDVESMPPSAGLRAHVELAGVTGYIVCETFKIAPRQSNAGYTTQSIDKALALLEEWRDQLPPSLALMPDPCTPDPACYSLHMAQLQLVILTTRPVLLATTKHAIAARCVHGQWSVEQHPHAGYIRICADAALQNLVLAQRLKLKRKLLQAGLHFVFNAAVILLLHRIIRSNRGSHTSPLDGHADSPMSPMADQQNMPEIQFAIDAFEQESVSGTNYTKDCFEVLRDLKAITDQYVRPTRAIGDIHDDFRALMMTWMQDDAFLQNSLLI